MPGPGRVTGRCRRPSSDGPSAPRSRTCRTQRIAHGSPSTLPALPEVMLRDAPLHSVALVADGSEGPVYEGEPQHLVLKNLRVRCRARAGSYRGSCRFYRGCRLYVKGRGGERRRGGEEGERIGRGALARALRGRKHLSREEDAEGSQLSLRTTVAAALLATCDGISCCCASRTTKLGEETGRLRREGRKKASCSRGQGGPLAARPYVTVSRSLFLAMGL